MPTDQNATPATRALYDFLKRSSSGPTMFGHQDALAYGVNWKDFHEFRTDVFDVCGKHPAVFGWDIGKIGPRPSNLDLVDFRHMRFWMREVFRRGGINTVSWHANNFLGGDAWAVGTPTVAAILPGGSHHQAYRDKLELIAGFLRKVTTGPPDYQPVPIIFRPFHEHTGNWFWWGKPHASAAEYIELWRFTVAIPKADWWTGSLLKGILADPVAARIAWALVWRNDNVKHHYAPYPGHVSAEDFRRFAESPEVRMLDGLGPVYRQEESV